MANANAPPAASDGFRKAMLKTALETIPPLTKEDYSIGKGKLTALLKLRGVYKAIYNPVMPLGEAVTRN